jgi:hypothetical protein
MSTDGNCRDTKEPIQLWNIVSFAEPDIVCKRLGNFRLEVVCGMRRRRNVPFEVISGQEQGRGNRTGPLVPQMVEQIPLTVEQIWTDRVDGVLSHSGRLRCKGNAWRLRRFREAQFEDHFISCPFCAERLQFTEDFIKAVRHAAARLRGPSAAGA